MIPTNRIINLSRISQSRCCSFCRQPGHTINFCNDERIQNFEFLCLGAKILFESNVAPINMFNHWLSEKYLESPLLVKCFAVRKCRCTLRAGIERCISSITNYIYEIYENDNYMPFTVDSEDTIENNGILTLRGILRGILLLQGYTSEDISDLDSNNALNINYENIKYNFITSVETLKNPEKCDCSICFENYEKEEFVKLNCNHEFCSVCLIETIKAAKSNNPRCAFCRADITKIVTYLPKINCKFDKFKI